MRLAAMLLAGLAATATPAAAAVPPPTPGAIALFEEGGEYVVRTDASSMAIYTFAKDARGKSNCNGVCAATWPPIFAGSDATPIGDWSLVRRGDGSMQWAYKGMPVYTFSKDSAGTATGDGLGGVWRLVKLGPVN